MGASLTEDLDEPEQGSLEAVLAEFAAEHKISTKGALCLPLVVTDHARTLGLPLDAARLRTGADGQVLGLGKGRVQAILARHGIERILAEEGGRTSRGSLGRMNAYVALLNEMHAADPTLDLEKVEAFWINRVRGFFAAKPFSIRADPTISLTEVLENLFEQVEARQRESTGATILGTVLQHLVGARLSLIDHGVEHHSASTKDEGQARPGDFQVGDLALHVSTAPGEALIRKCQVNLSGGQRPIIVTIGRGCSLAKGLAENAGLGGRIDVWDATQWLATCIVESGGNRPEGRLAAVRALTDRYNAIVDSVETDPSLRIDVATGRV